MWFGQQRRTIRWMIAVNFLIEYSLCSTRSARGYTSSIFAQERSVNRLEAVIQPVRSRGLEMAVMST